MTTFPQLIYWGESRLELKFQKKICCTDSKLFLISPFLILQKICLADFILLTRNVKSEPISYS